jgi:hypothetical protein
MKLLDPREVELDGQALKGGGPNSIGYARLLLGII